MTDHRTLEELKRCRADLVRQIDRLKEDLGTAEAILEDVEIAIEERGRPTGKQQ